MTPTSSHPRIARDCERAIQEGRMSITEAQSVKRFYENELDGYAYLEVEADALKAGILAFANDISLA